MPLLVIDSLTKETAMTFLSDFESWGDARDNAQFSAGAASRQAELDAANQKVADLTAQVATSTTSYTSLKAQLDKATADLLALQSKYDAYVNSHPDVTTPPVTPTAEVIEFKDFAQQHAGKLMLTGSLVGKGVDLTKYRMTPNTSTHKAEVAALAQYDSNQCNLMHFGGMDGNNIAQSQEIAGFTLEGTEQGHYYNGMRIGYTKNAYIHDVKFLNAGPGNSSSPPGETFTLNAWRSDGLTVRNLVLDGRNASGTPNAGSLLGYDFVKGTTLTENVKANYTSVAFAVAMWRNSGTQIFNNCDFSNCRKAINIEESVGGSYEFNKCVFKNITGAPYMAQVSAITTSAKIVFRDPVVSSYPFKVNAYDLGAGLTGGPNKQLDSDITCFINGVDVTKDSTKFQVTHI